MHRHMSTRSSGTVRGRSFEMSSSPPPPPNHQHQHSMRVAEGRRKINYFTFFKSVRNSLVGPHKKEGEMWRAKRVCGFLFGVLYRSRRDAVLQWCKSAHKTGLARCFWTVEGADRMRWMKNLWRAYFSSLPEEGFIQGHTYIRTYTHTHARKCF